MVPKRNIVAYSVLLFLLSPPAFSKKLFNLGGGNGNASPSASPIAQEDFATLVADNIPAVPVTGNVMTNDSNGAFATLTSSPASKYGTIIFNGDGSFSYNVYPNIPEVMALKPGDVLFDRFNYAYSDNFGNKAFSTLNISIIVSGSNQLRAQEDFATIVADSVPAVPVTGNVITNDSNGSFATLTSSPASKYGAIIFNSDGSFSYNISPNIPEIMALKQGDELVDRFNYAYSDIFGNKVFSTLNISIVVSGANQLSAQEDSVTIVANKDPEVAGNVIENDSNGDFATLTSSVVGKYGYIIFNRDGSFSYTLDSNSPEVIALKAREIAAERFTYRYSDKLGHSVDSALNITVIGNPVDGSGNTIFKQPEDSPFDNVDIEFNDRSAQATPLNSALNIKGHLYKSSDKDWYKIPSNGNESLIFEVCPQGSSCFGQKSWVLYIFDSSLLTEAMEREKYSFHRWLDETGTTTDLNGDDLASGANPKMSADAGSSNHMYLAYKAGFFDGALIGIVDPCFGSLNSVEVGLPVNPNNADGTPVLDTDGKGVKPQDYLIAISSPLKGDGGGDCGVGSVVLNKPGRSAAGKDAEGKAKTYETTEEYIVVAPNSDDQYTIKVTSTGRNPLLSAEAQKKSSALDAKSRSLKIPKIRIGEQLFSANLELRSSVAGQPLLFSVADIAALGSDANTAYLREIPYELMASSALLRGFLSSG